MAIASRYWTYAELLAQVEKETDTEDELFIQSTEMMGHANQAIDEAERIVKATYADYFLDKDTVTLVAGTQEYSLPSRIYAHKIRRITYRLGSDVYTIRRVKDWKKFEEYEEEQAAGSTTGNLRYFILNQTAGAPKILLTRAPTSAEASATVTVWFTRQANRISSTSDTLDIPEAANYVMQYMKLKIYEKEGHPNIGLAVAMLNKEEEALRGDLADMVPDADDELEMDASFYDEMN